MPLYPLQIHQIYPDTYLRKTPLLLNIADPALEELAGVHQAGKDDVVLLEDIAKFLLVLVQDEDGVVVKLVFFSLKGELVTHLYGFKDGTVLEMVVPAM